MLESSYFDLLICFNKEEWRKAKKIWLGRWLMIPYAPIMTDERNPSEYGNFSRTILLSINRTR